MLPTTVLWADSKQVPTQQPRAHWMPKAYLDSKKCSNQWKKMQSFTILHRDATLTWE